MKFIWLLFCLLLSSTTCAAFDASDKNKNKNKNKNKDFHAIDSLKLYGLQFDFGGVTFAPFLVEDNVCPEQWPSVAQCIMNRCSNFIEVCPFHVAITKEKDDGKEEEEEEEEVNVVARSSNSFMDGEDTKEYIAGSMPLSTTAAEEFSSVNDCKTYQMALCETLMKGTTSTKAEEEAEEERCCLSDCIGPIQQWVTCVLEAKYGVVIPMTEEEGCVVPEDTSSSVSVSCDDIFTKNINEHEHDVEHEVVEDAATERTKLPEQVSQNQSQSNGKSTVQGSGLLLLLWSMTVLHWIALWFSH